eukprot:COSAG05_NODE_4072_length_1686_cov_3.850662_3_plen_63_part_01
MDAGPTSPPSTRKRNAAASDHPIDAVETAKANKAREAKRKRATAAALRRSGALPLHRSLSARL